MVNAHKFVYYPPHRDEIVVTILSVRRKDMNYVLLWLYYCIRDNLQIWVSTVITAAISIGITAAVKYVRSFYGRWIEERRERKHAEDQQQSLRSLELSVSG